MLPLAERGPERGWSCGTRTADTPGPVDPARPRTRTRTADTPGPGAGGCAGAVGARGAVGAQRPPGPARSALPPSEPVGSAQRPLID